MGIAQINELPHYTYDDYKQWEGDWELIGGIPYAMVPSPTIKHQSIASKIISVLDNSIEHCPDCQVLHEQDWKIDETTTVRPDVVLVCHEDGDTYITKRPELAFEVVSKNSIQRDEEIKFRLFAEEKVPYYILVYPDDLKAKAFRLKGNQYEKIGDYTKDNLFFDGLDCDLELDFDAIFKKFRIQQ